MRAIDCLSLDDFEIAARGVLPRPLFGFLAGAAEDHRAFQGNRAAFERWALRTRVLVDVSKRSTEVELFGQRLAAPFGIAPMGLSALCAYRGDVALARAAQAARVPMIVSATSLIRLEDVLAEARASQAEAPLPWFQAYLPGEPERIDALLDRVAGSGVQVLVVTADVPLSGNRENNVRAGFSTPLRPSLRLAWDGLARPRWLLGTFGRTLLRHGMPHFENAFAERGAPLLSSRAVRDLSARDHLSWAHLERIRARWKGKLVIKGILSGEDTARARALGADGVIASNHGGRQLDHAVAPLAVLPEVVAAAGDMAVMLDGGVRRGTEVIKALALGARCVFVGRPMLMAAAVGGQAGVARAIELLQAELHRNLALMGMSGCGQLTPAHLMPR